MKVPTTALMSVVLVLTALSTMAGPTFDVNVANLPLDEQGNLKVAAQESLHTYRDCVEISVLISKDTGIFIRSPFGPDPDVNHPLALSFSFSSKQDFQRVTDLWISLEVEGSIEPVHKYRIAHFELDCIFNNGPTYHIDEEQRLIEVNHILTVHIQDEDMLSPIIPSINNLTLMNPEIRQYGAFRYYSMIIYRVSVFIEYEYQAR